MPLATVTNMQYTLTGALLPSDVSLPVSSAAASDFGSRVGTNFVYLSVHSPTAVEVVKATYAGGLIAIQRAQSGTAAITAPSGSCVLQATDTVDFVAAATDASRIVVATASRPSAVTAGAGAQIYDTTLGIPLWSNGTVWRNASGTAV
jgi:hypothetical protein